MSGYPATKRRVWGALFAGLLALSACASSSAGVGRSTSTSTATASGPQPTPLVPTPGDTRICGVIAPAEFAQIAATSATEITSGATDDSLTGLQEVYCIYDDASDPHQLFARGTINYEFAQDSASAASIFDRVRQTFSGVLDVAGVGDSAFAGTPGGTAEGSGFGLLVLRGTLLLYLSVAGDEKTVVSVTKPLAMLALSRVAE